MIALVGAGPLGIEMAVALKRAGLEYVQFEEGQVGATMVWWAPGTRWFSSNERIAIAGVPLVTVAQEKASREEYLAYLRGVVEQFGLEVRTYTRVTGVERERAGFRVRYASALGDEELLADKVILVTGGTAVANLIGVPGEDLPHVSHYFQEPHRYFQKRVLIVGGRNSAVEAALRCYRAGARVHFCYHGTGVDAKDIKYWLYPEFSSLVKAGKIVGHFGREVAEILPGEVKLRAAGATSAAAAAQGEESRRAGTTATLPIDFVLLMTGYRADMSLAAAAGVALNGDQLIPAYDPATMETNVPGLYVAGTAIAGTQRRYKVFLENCHIHVERILAHLTGKAPPREGAAFERPES
jgi:thioredoxin reductase (NADPH)